MNKTLEGMARAYEVSFLSSTGDANTRAEAIKATLLWLAGDCEDIAEHVCKSIYNIPHDECVPSPMLDQMTDAISAALRAAAYGGEK